MLRKTYLSLAVAHVYNNTVYSANKGISFDTAATIEDAVTGNLVFAANPISGHIANLSNNTVDVFSNAATYVNAPSFSVGAMDFYPLAGRAQGPAVDLSAFGSETDSARDFNGVATNAPNQAIVFRGAYAGEGTNPGWKLQAAIKPSATPSNVPAVLNAVACVPTLIVVGEVAGELHGHAGGARRALL